ncbi:MAG: hypothetical protein V8S57_04080 [Oscillospiraceae bacterium]
MQPDPRIELTGPDTLWRTTNEPQPQATIAAACKDMDKDTHVDWTLTEGEGIVTLETPEGAGAANQSVIVKATADGAGKAVITASTANGITASLTIYVIPQITTVELEGVVAVGETVRAKINVLGGGEYDYENFPKLKIEWRYLTAADYSRATPAPARIRRSPARPAGSTPSRRTWREITCPSCSMTPSPENIKRSAAPCASPRRKSVCSRPTPRP